MSLSAHPQFVNRQLVNLTIPTPARRLDPHPIARARVKRDLAGQSLPSA